MDMFADMFVPAEDPNGSERRVVADQPVVIYKPRRKVIGMTFVITAANMPLSKYESIITALTSSDHVVIGYFVNIFNPPLPRNHRQKAERIPKIFNELKKEFGVNCYSLVGHSVGGKIALLATALYDEHDSIRSVVALDPVDQSPVEFTHEPKPLTEGGGSSETEKKNLSLEQSKADIAITFTDTGYFISKKHNAREIQKNNPSVKLILHRNSCHMVYCDEGGLLSWKALMGKGKSSGRNRVVRDETIQLIKDRATRSTVAGSAAGAVTNSVGKAKKSLTNGIADVKGMAQDAQNRGSAMAGAAKVWRVMG